MWYILSTELPINGLIYNFLPSWWNRGYGLSFGREFVFDPDYRVYCYCEMEQILWNRFPGMAMGCGDPKPRVVPPDFGNAATAAAAGCRVDYPVDNYPWNHHLALEKIRTLEVPDSITEAFPYSEIIHQVGYLNEKTGSKVESLLVPRGILNDAFLIRGEELFIDRQEDPEGADRLIRYCRGVLESVIRANAVFGRSDTMIITNCTVPFVGPDAYEQWLLPLDLGVYGCVGRAGLPYGIHHCGIADPYLAFYRRMSRVDFLEIGWDSDLRRAMETFPEAVVQYIYSAGFLLSASRGEVETRTAEILEAAGSQFRRLRMSVPDIEHGTRDENLYAVFETIKRWKGKGAVQ